MNKKAPPAVLALVSLLVTGCAQTDLYDFADENLIDPEEMVTVIIQIDVPGAGTAGGYGNGDVFYLPLENGVGSIDLDGVAVSGFNFNEFQVIDNGEILSGATYNPDEKGPQWCRFEFSGPGSVTITAIFSPS